MQMMTTPSIKYYDHFLMKEIPSFMSEQSVGQKEAVSAKKEISMLIRNLNKINLLNFGMSIADKSLFLVQVLKDYTVSVNLIQTKFNLLKSQVRSSKMADEEFRRQYKLSYKSAIKELEDLMTEIEPVMREAKTFTEAIFYVSNSYSHSKISTRVNMDLIRPLAFVFSPIRKLVQYSQS